MNERGTSDAAATRAEASGASLGPDLSRRAILAAGAMVAAGALPASRGVAAAPPAAGSGPAPLPATASRERVLTVSRAALSPDGGPEVPSVVVNGSIPGPELRFREGEIFRVLTENRMEDEPTSIHWHGMLVPSGMDGVPGLSNVPIPPRRWYVYEFPLRQAGTYWYHSHVGFQEQRGLFGALVIEEADDPVRADHDPVVLLSDWLHADPMAVFERLRTGDGMKGMGPMGPGPMDPGRKMAPGMTMPAAGAKPVERGGGGSMGDGPDLSDVKYDAFLLNGRGTRGPWTFAARPGERIRLRVVNGGASTAFKVSLDGHAFTVTHADGMPVVPVEVDWLLMGMGETYDLLVALKAPGAYTLHAVAQDGSGQAAGVLHTPDVEPVASLAMPSPGPRQLSYDQLRSPTPTTLPEGPLRTIRLPLRGDMARYVWTLGDVPYPKAEPLLVRRGERVRVELVNETGMWHPMHLHGHFYRLLGRGDEFAPLKHTANVAPGKTLAFEFLADNPGSWIFHCHNLYHLEGGMARVFEYEV